MLFVFLDFYVDFGGSRIGLIPDFIGYILIAYGLKELTTGSDRFSRVRPLVIVMVVYTAFLYGMDFLGAPFFLIRDVYFILGLVSVLISLYISYKIVTGIKALETGLEQDLEGRRLYSVWAVSAILSLVVYALNLLPVPNWLCNVAGLIVGIVFLVYLNRTRRLYYGGI